MTEADADVERVRRLMPPDADVVEKRLVGGGWGFMVDGDLCCGVSARGLTVRVGADAMDEVLTSGDVDRLVLGGRPTAAFVVVQPDGYRDDDALQHWVERGLRFVDTLG